MVALFSHKLRAAWEFTPGLPIWRLHPPVGGCIIGETRDVESKRASFFALESESGRCVWRDREFHDPWWVAIERVRGDKLVLHGYTAPDQPILRGVTVVEIPGGTVVLSDAAWTGDEHLLAAAGVPLDAAGIPEETAFPDMIDPQNPGDEWPAILSGWPIDEIAGGIEIADQGSYTVSAAHVKHGSGERATLTHMLKIHNAANGRIEYDDVIVAAAKGIAPDAFFITGSMLYYIRERKTLVAVRL
jgi:hypothetical protein